MLLFCFFCFNECVSCSHSKIPYILVGNDLMKSESEVSLKWMERRVNFVNECHRETSILHVMCW